MKTVTDMTHDLTTVVRFVTDYARDHGLIQFDPKTKIKVKALGDYDGTFCWHRNTVELDAGLPLETAIITLIHELKHSEQRYLKRRQVKVASDTGVLTPHWLGVAYDIDEDELPEDEYLALPWEIEARAAELLAPQVIAAFIAIKG
jgi:hypothetical protein